LFELLVAKTPFEGEQNRVILNNILERKLIFPEGFDPNAMDLVDKLLALNPEERLGYRSMDELKEHPFLEGIDFEKLEKREIKISLMDFYKEKS